MGDPVSTTNASVYRERLARVGGSPRIPRVCEGPGEPGLVSVLVPTFNRAYILPRSLDSVLAQTYRPLELIVVDDGSRDDTRSVVAAYGDRVRYVYQENAGLASARNTGLSAARGEFVAFQDSDDVWMPWKLEAQVALMRHFTGLAIAWTDMSAVDPEGNVLMQCALAATLGAYRLYDIWNWLRRAGSMKDFLPSSPPEIAASGVRVGDLFTPMFLGNLVHPPVALMRRSAVQRAGGLDLSMTWSCEDYEFFWRVAREGQGALIEAPGMLYRVEAPDQLTRPDLLLLVARGNLAAIQRRLREKTPGIALPRAMVRSRMAKAHAWVAEEELFSPYGRRREAVHGFLASLRREPWHKRRVALLLVSLCVPRAAFGWMRAVKRWLRARRSVNPAGR